MKKKIKNMLILIAMRFFQLFPIKNNKVIFSSFGGKLYNDAPRIISEELEKYGLFDLVWILPKEYITSAKIRIVNRGSWRMLYELATAKVWVDNTRKDIWTRKRKGQFYIQTWHGGVALKKVEKDAADRLHHTYIKSAMRDSKMADLFVSESEWRTRNYIEAFWFSGEIVKGGIVRGQKIDKEVVLKKVKAELNIDSDVRIALYAPTFRNSHNVDIYNMDYEKIICSLQNRFGGRWCIVVRLHPNIIQLNDKMNYCNKVKNGSKYPVLSDLLTASEVLITDFSGCMFDALRENKNLFLYASDYDTYIRTERELYFDLMSFPTPLTKSNDELCNVIENFNEELYFEKRAKLLEYIGFYSTDGKTEIVNRVIDIICQNS